MITKEQINKLKNSRLNLKDIPDILNVFESDETFFDSIAKIIKEPVFTENYISLLKITSAILYQIHIQDTESNDKNGYLFKPTHLMISFHDFIQEGSIFFARAIPVNKWQHLAEEQFELLWELLDDNKLASYSNVQIFKIWKEKVYALGSELRKKGELIDP